MARSTRTSGKGKKATATTTKQPAAKKAAKNGGGKGATSKAKTTKSRATNNTKAKGKGTKKALGKHNPNIESDEEIEDEGVPTKKEKTTRATRSRKVCGVVYYFNTITVYYHLDCGVAFISYNLVLWFCVVYCDVLDWLYEVYCDGLWWMIYVTIKC